MVGLVQVEDYKIYPINVCNILTGYYGITSDGCIYNLKRRKPMRATDDADGYYKISLCTNEMVGNEHKRRTFRVSKLVMLVFGGNPPEDMIDATVDHIDGNKKNNNVSNLRWLERAVNSSVKVNVANGERNGSAKLTDSDVIAIRDLLSNGQHTLKQIGDMFGVSKSTINNINRNVNWKHIGSTGKL